MEESAFKEYVRERLGGINKERLELAYDLGRGMQTQETLLLETVASDFIKAVYSKARAAQVKYNFPAYGWATPDWQAELQAGIAEHLQKGDPRDVAVYAMFAWFHGWPTAPKVGAAPLVLQGDGPADLLELTQAVESLELPLELKESGWISGATKEKYYWLVGAGLGREGSLIGWYAKALQACVNATPSLLLQLAKAKADLAAALNTLNLHNAPAALAATSEGPAAAATGVSGPATDGQLYLLRMDLMAAQLRASSADTNYEAATVLRAENQKAIDKISGWLAALAAAPASVTSPQNEAEDVTIAIYGEWEMELRERIEAQRMDFTEVAEAVSEMPRLFKIIDALRSELGRSGGTIHDLKNQLAASITSPVEPPSYSEAERIEFNAAWRELSFASQRGGQVTVAADDLTTLLAGIQLYIAHNLELLNPVEPAEFEAQLAELELMLEEYKEATRIAAEPGPLTNAVEAEKARQAWVCISLEAVPQLISHLRAALASPVGETGPYSGSLRIPVGNDLLALSRQLRADAERTRVRHSIRTAFCAVNIDDLVRFTAAVEAALTDYVGGAEQSSASRIHVQKQARDLHYQLIEQFGLQDNGPTNLKVRNLLVQALRAVDLQTETAGERPSVGVAAAWVPVDEYLPENDGEYLVYGNCTNSGVGVDIAKFDTFGFDPCGPKIFRKHSQPTHWQPLPAAPQSSPTDESQR